MSEPPLPLPALSPEGFSPVTARALLHDVPHVFEALRGTLEIAFDTGVEHVHLEPFESGWRLRLRHDEGLEERLLPAGHPLPEALARLSRHARAVTVPLGREPQLLEIVARETTRGASYLLTLHGSALAPRRLDALGLDPRELKTLRAQLRGAPRGWLPIGTSSALDGASVVRAIAQELASPERALLCLESGPHPALPRVLQIDIADALPDPLAPDTDAVLMAAAPPDAVLTALAARAGPELLVVQHTIARRPSDVLSRLLALGLTPAWLALTVPALTMRYRVRLLCPHCRIRDAQREPERLEGAASGPGIVDVAAWLESTLATRYRRGEGCRHCHDSGHRGVRELTEIVAMGEAVRSALLANESSAALALVDASSALVTRLPALVAGGDIAAEEATRHLMWRR